MTRPVSRVSRVLMTGPLAAYADACRIELMGQGYTALSTVNEIRQLRRLSGWLAVTGLSAADLSVERVDDFLEEQRARGSRVLWSRPGLVCMVEVLRSLGVVGPERPGPEDSAEDLLLGSFEHFLLVERGLAPGTVRGYVEHARRFLAGLDLVDGLGSVRPADVTSAVLRESTAVSVATTQNFVAGLKSFLRFCFVEGLVTVDLSEAALAITGRRRSLLPRGISAGDAKALLASCDRRSALGRRDYAVLVILLRLGLRDRRWRDCASMTSTGGPVRWWCAASARQDRLPLPADVGGAIAALPASRTPGR